MKRGIFHFLLIIIVGVALVGCKDNFNELTDTDHRYIRFEFDSSNYFSNLLVEDGKGGFVMGMPFELSATERLRISAYCYDMENALVAQKSTLSADGKNLSLEFNHLLKNKQYRFVFFVDIVEYDSQLEYLEIWYQLQTYSYNSFYLLENNLSDVAQRNILLHNELILSPNNQVECVLLHSWTYNGYTYLNNTDEVESAELTARTAHDINVATGESKYVVLYRFKRDKNNFSESIQTTHTTNLPKYKFTLTLTKSSGEEEYEFSVEMSKKPFTLQVDCKNLTYELCDNF